MHLDREHDLQEVDKTDKSAMYSINRAPTGIDTEPGETSEAATAGGSDGALTEGVDARPKKRAFFIHRNFALLWSGQTVSEFGSRITR